MFAKKKYLMPFQFFLIYTSSVLHKLNKQNMVAPSEKRAILLNIKKTSYNSL